MQAREQLLALDTMEDLHTFLVNFDPFKAAQSMDELAMRSVKLIRDLPPERMAQRCRTQFVHCCTVEARLVNETWWVPEQPPQRSKLDTLRQKVQPLVHARVAKHVVGSALLVTMSTGVVMWLLGGSGYGANFDVGL